MVVDEETLRAMVYGGALLGAGGGGSIAAGLACAREALLVGDPRIVDLAQMPQDATLVTLSSVGTVGGTTGRSVDHRHFARALELFSDWSIRRIDGFIASEVGPAAVTYGLRESAVTGIPVVDAPCNGRAHPLFIMGSLGLHRFPRHLAPTIAVGGRPRTAEYVELAIHANVSTAARIVRDRVAQTKIALAVVRNPVSAEFAGRRAAVGALKHASRIGRVVLSRAGVGLDNMLAALERETGGRTIARGTVKIARLTDAKGFTVGKVVVERPGDRDLTIPLCNEFMMALDGARPVASFPDVIAIIDHENCLPLASNEVRVGRRVAVFMVPQERLILGAAMQDATLLRPIATTLGVRFPDRFETNDTKAMQ